MTSPSLSGPSPNESSVALKISALKKSIEETAQKAGRNPGEIRLLLVTKTVPVGLAGQAFQAGVRDFGENRVQDLLKKKIILAPEIRWHMIGSLQTNKVKDVLGEVALIHSLDRPELAIEIEKQAARKNIGTVDCLIQVNSSGETTKSGFAAGNVSEFVRTLQQDSRIRIRGLMTIGPTPSPFPSPSGRGEGEGMVRRAFALVRQLREQLKQEFPECDWSILSMGMSGDYKIAIEEGSTLLRIGTAVFGDRESL